MTLRRMRYPAMGMTPLLIMILVILSDVTAVPMEKEDYHERRSPMEYNMYCDAPDGTVMASFPSKCLQLVCHWGQVVPQYIYDEQMCNCCEHNGQIYKEGDILPAVCVRMYCRSGQWVTTNHIHECCEQCKAYNDPHIRPFDARTERYYDWHIPCNYSLTQRLHYEPYFPDSYNPEYAVYAYFEPCSFGSSVTCMGTFTFKDNPGTVIEINSGDLSYVVVNGLVNTINPGVTVLNGPSGPQPVLAWQYGSTIRLLGSQGLFLQVSQHYIMIYAHASLYDKLRGLCGRFNYYEQDDHTTRSGFQTDLTYYPTPPNPAFPMSWLTMDNSDKICYTNTSAATTLSCDLEQTEKAIKLCSVLEGITLDRIETENAIGACAFDLCAIMLDKQDDKLSWWVQQWVIMLIDSLVNTLMTIGENEVLKGYGMTDTQGEGNGKGRDAIHPPIIQVPGAEQQMNAEDDIGIQVRKGSKKKGTDQDINESDHLAPAEKKQFKKQPKQNKKN